MTGSMGAVPGLTAREWEDNHPAMRAAALRRASTVLPFAVLVASAGAACTLDVQGTGGSGAGGAPASPGDDGGGGEGSVDGLPNGMLYGWSASAPAQPGIYELPGWLTLESPTPDKTVQ